MRWLRKPDHGAAAVLYAVLLPILVLIACGIVDAGRAVNAHVALSQAAREGAMLVAVDDPNIPARTRAAAMPLTGVRVTTVAACRDGARGHAVVQTQYDFSFVTPLVPASVFFGQGFHRGPVTLTGRGVAQCAG